MDKYKIEKQLAIKLLIYNRISVVTFERENKRGDWTTYIIELSGLLLREGKLKFLLKLWRHDKISPT